MAVYSIGVPLGSGVALILSGLVIKAIEGWPAPTLPGFGALEPWRLTFLFVGLPGLLVALLMLTVKEPVRRGAAAASGRGIKELFAFVRQQWRALLPHFAGLSALTFVIYGYMAWIPTFFARTYGVKPADITLVYGLTTAICGAIGLLLGGALADRLFSRGVLDGHLRTVRWAVVTSAPFLIAMPLMPDATFAALLFAPAFLLASMHGGVAGAALQVISPNRLRGQITALYFFVANLIGLGLGPTAVALVTDYGFHDDAALRYSLAAVAATALPISALILTLGFPAFRRAAAIRRQHMTTPPVTRFLCEATIELRAGGPISLGTSPWSARRVSDIASGRFEGPRLAWTHLSERRRLGRAGRRSERRVDGPHRRAVVMGNR